MGKYNDLTGQKFGRLTVIKDVGRNKSHKVLWLCKCECGNTKIINGNSLKNGSTISCGCYQKERAKETQTTHGMEGTRIYRIWKNIKVRCLYPKAINYKWYGGRGIKICDKWLKFEGFYEDMYLTYKEGLSIDRINSDGNYCKENCKWSTKIEQANNQSNNFIITYNGYTDTLMNMCKKYKLEYKLVETRLNKLHWSIEKAFTTPVQDPIKYLKYYKHS